MHRGVQTELKSASRQSTTQRHSSRLATISHRKPIASFRVAQSGPRYLVCASLGFSNPDTLETEIFLTSSQQPNVGLFPLRAGGPSQLLQSRQI